MSPTRTIDVRRQRNLTLRETLHLCVKGITHRLLRSVLTLAVVTLAVAFFMFLLSENAYVGSVGAGVRQEDGRLRFAAQTLNTLFAEPSLHGLTERLADAARPGATEAAELAAVVGWERERVLRLARLCALEGEYVQFFETLPTGKRLILVQKRTGSEIFRRLQDPAERAAFEQRIMPMVDVRVPGDLSGLMAFVEGFASYEAEVAAFAAAWHAALQTLADRTAAMTGGAAAEDWLRTASPEAIEAWGAMVRAAGFVMTGSDLALLQTQLRESRLRQDIYDALSTPAKIDEWRRVFKGKRVSADEKMLELDDARVPALLDNVYTRAQLAGVAASAAYGKRLAELDRRLSGKVDGAQAEQRLSGRQILLLVISFLVCMTGIANAMLMSITERFREIATMKCLGATDRFILVQFMLEAGLQGLVGSTLGLVVGWLIALLKDLALFGTYVIKYWPGGAVAASGAVALLAGVLLSVMASIYPSWAASRMAPMEAMRVE